jgi:SAM-dependent methyltransferase
MYSLMETQAIGRDAINNEKANRSLQCIGLSPGRTILIMVLFFRVHPWQKRNCLSILYQKNIGFHNKKETVFREIARILRPQGYFIITFSNRWFPGKAAKIWSELHEFKRVGLVLEYFNRSQRFKDLQTYSLGGLARPRNDKYFPAIKFSDPVFAVWGQKA